MDHCYIISKISCLSQTTIMGISDTVSPTLENPLHSNYRQKWDVNLTKRPQAGVNYEYGWPTVRKTVRFSVSWLVSRDYCNQLLITNCLSQKGRLADFIFWSLFGPFSKWPFLHFPPKNRNWKKEHTFFFKVMSGCQNNWSILKKQLRTYIWKKITFF